MDGQLNSLGPGGFEIYNFDFTTCKQETAGFGWFQPFPHLNTSSSFQNKAPAKNPSHRNTKKNNFQASSQRLKLALKVGKHHLHNPPDAHCGKILRQSTLVGDHAIRARWWKRDP